MSWKTFLIFALLLAVSVTAGWRTGSTAKAAILQKRAAATFASSPMDGSAAASATGLNAHPAPASHAISIEEVKSELQQMEAMDDSTGSEILMMRMMGRLGNLMASLTAEQQTALLLSLPQEDQQALVMALRIFAPLLTPRNITPGQHFEKTAADLSATEAASGVLVSWAAQEPAGALQRWKAEMAKPEPAPWAGQATGNFFLQLSQADPRLAVDEALKLPDGKVRHKALEMLNLTSLYKEDKSAWPHDGDELVKRLINASPDTRQNALRWTLTARLRQETPQEAQTWIESLDLGTDSAAWTDRALAQAWTQKDRPAAADWQLSRTAPEARAGVTEEIVKQWTNANTPREHRLRQPEPDLAGCADWIIAQGIGPQTEEAVSVLADAWIDIGEPAAALAWAQAVSGQEARAATLQNITTQIRRRYPDTWRAMLNEAGVPAGE